MDRTPTIATDRLVLRPLRQTDAPAIQRILSGPHISRFTVSFPHPYPPGAALAWIREEVHRQQHGTSHPWAITLPGDEVIGFIGIALHEDGTEAHIGYWIDHRHWGRGYATEAARAVIAFGFDGLGLYRIEARCFAENVASGRVLRKAGMSLECYLHGGFRDKDGNPRDGEIYSITRPVDALPSRREPS